MTEMKVKTGQLSVELVDHMGNDLSVVNAARVSFNKFKETMDEQDEKLIGYLVRNNHWSPLAHTAISLRVKAPIFLARQLGKHQVGLVWNEVSRRYVDDKPEFYLPDQWRKRPDGSVKQGSSDKTITHLADEDGQLLDIHEAVEYAIENCRILYEWMIDDGVAPEQARMVLPQSMMTEWIWTGSLVAFARIFELRSDPHAQKEAQQFADMLHVIMRKLYPVTWKALIDQS